MAQGRDARSECSRYLPCRISRHSAGRESERPLTEWIGGQDDRSSRARSLALKGSIAGAGIEPGQFGRRTDPFAAIASSSRRPFRIQRAPYPAAPCSKVQQLSWLTEPAPGRERPQFLSTNMQALPPEPESPRAWGRTFSYLWPALLVNTSARPGAMGRRPSPPTPTPTITSTPSTKKGHPADHRRPSSLLVGFWCEVAPHFDAKSETLSGFENKVGMGTPSRTRNTAEPSVRARKCSGYRSGLAPAPPCSLVRVRRAQGGPHSCTRTRALLVDTPPLLPRCTPLERAIVGDFLPDRPRRSRGHACPRAVATPLAPQEVVLLSSRGPAPIRRGTSPCAADPA
jgi:hypothetical protein